MVSKRSTTVIFLSLCCLVCVSIIILGNDVVRNHRLFIKNANHTCTENHQGISESVKMPQRNATLVLILTYMRSGSSFTGRLIENHNDTFYAFEPLKVLEHMNKKRDIRPKQVELIKNWLTCNLTQNNILKSEFVLRNGEKTKIFKNCLANNKLKGIKIKENCVKNFIEMCRKSRVRIVKTIRLNLKTIVPFFLENENLKIIHLIRDPRAVSLSRSKIHPKPPPSNSFNLCSSLRSNLQKGRELNSTNRYRILRYETVADEPYESLKDIYNFLNLDPTFESIGKLYTQTHADGLRETPFGTSRKSSAATAVHWRSDISDSLLKQVDKSCHHIYDSIGYFQADLKTVRNLSIPLKHKQNGTFFQLPKYVSFGNIKKNSTNTPKIE